MVNILKNHSLIKEKVRLIALLDEYFPELRKLFSDILGKSSLEILKKCPFSKDIKTMGIYKITELLKIATKNRVGIKKAILVCEAAENSIGIPVGLDVARYRLNLIIKNLENIQQQIDDIEIMMQEYLAQTGYSQYILSIKTMVLQKGIDFIRKKIKDS